MNKLTYHYSAVSKQVWLYICALYLLIWGFVFVEIKLFRIKGYYENMNLSLSLLLLLLGTAFFILLSFQHHLCYSLYDKEKIIYYNKLTRTQKTLYYKDCHAVIFDTRGIKFYESEEKLVNKEKPLLFIPFFRFGKIEAIPLNQLYIFFEQRQKEISNPAEFSLYKAFKILPGYGRRWKYLSFFYACLCIVSLSSCATPLSIAVGIILSHG